MKKLIFLGIVIPFLITSTISGCMKKTSSKTQNNFPVSSWDEGFNVAWAGTYVSKEDADYVVAFKLGTDGTYAFVYGSNLSISTTYSGKYNKNFRNGVSKSGLNYRITEIRVTGFDKTSISLSVDWRLPSGNDTARYVLYRK